MAQTPKPPIAADHVPAGVRRVRREVALNKQAIAAVTPFLRQFDSWHARSALLQARLLAGRGDAATVHAELHSLIEDVTDGYRSFRDTVADASRHGRIDDVENTFQRLLQSLRATRAGGPAERRDGP